MLSSAAIRAETITVSNAQAGTTPTLLGYNLGHFMPDSNAAAWFRYSGVNAARVFISVAEIEPADDLAPVGDGVDSETAFFSRRALMRAHTASTTEVLNSAYADWPAFASGYGQISSGNNRQQLSYALGNLRDRGIAILANLTASPSRFPIYGANDWARQWELWQHYYVQAFLLSRDYGVQHFSMFNEPNGWTGMTEADWLRRFRLCSDALQHGVADMNARHGRALSARIFAPNTANGAEKYHTIGAEESTTDTWGRDAVSHRHLRLDGTSSAAWLNLHVYNYQKYTTRPYATGGFSGFINDYNSLRALLNADMPGEPPLPMALTEFNVRTGANYDATTATQDSPADYASLGANCIALTEQGVQQLYLFKFGQTASASHYGVAKNGTHYVQNGPFSGYQYGGATKAAEVYRLFCKAACGARPRLTFTATAGASPSVNAGMWTLVSHDPSTGTRHLFLANRETAAIPLEVDVTAWDLPEGHAFFVEEVSSQASGGVVRVDELRNGRLASAAFPPQAVWLITIPGAPLVPLTQSAGADTQLRDGSSRDTPDGTATPLEVRSDGTVDGRRAALIRIPVPAGNTPEAAAILLQLYAAAATGTGPVQAHVYGVSPGPWTEATATWANLGQILKQQVPAGSTIQNNTANHAGPGIRMLGQLVVNTTVLTKHSLDVTEFVRDAAGGDASFLILQDHRWDVAQPSLSPGDLQPAGILLASREDPARAPQLLSLAPVPPWVLWQQRQFPDEWEMPLVAGPGADPDHDGLPNLLEYALGGDPMVASTGPLPQLNQGMAGVAIRLSRQTPHRDLKLTLQVSPHPGAGWTDAAVSTAGGPFVSVLHGINSSESGDGVARNVTLTVIQSAGRQFFRLKAGLVER
jgi:hypothetical protein